MKKIVKYAIIIAIIAIIIYFVRKARSATQIIPGIDSFKLNIPGKGLAAVANAAMQIVSGGLSATANLKLTSYGSSEITVNQVYAEIYNKNGSLLANQTIPLSNSFTIKPGINILPIPIDIKVAGVYQLANAIKNSNSGNEIPIWVQILTSYFTTGLLGTSINLKGYVVAESIKVNFDEVVNI